MSRRLRTTSNTTAGSSEQVLESPADGVWGINSSVDILNELANESGYTDATGSAPSNFHHSLIHQFFLNFFSSIFISFFSPSIT